MTRLTAALCAVFVLSAAPSAAQDAAAGEAVFKKCKSCHMVGDGAKNRVGPVLTGVIGRTAGTFEAYKYGKSMIKAGEAGLVWDEDQLFTYLADPKAFLRDYLDDSNAKAKMSFRLENEDDRRNVIAYLVTFSPTPAAQEAEEDEQAAVDVMDTAPNMLCVRNSNAHEHFFAVDVDGAERLTGNLVPGERLCTEAEPGLTGTVSVFETADELEGCSRLVQVGQTEDMLKYVDFDRCFWSSNT